MTELSLDLGLADDTITFPPAPVGIHFTVLGEPIPQGSTKGFVVGGQVRITNDNPRTRPWRALVADAARQCDPERLTGPVAVTLTFTLPRPKSRPKRDRYPDRRPDIDKLARAVLDALTGCCFTDDAQVVDLTCSKVYVGDTNALPEPGVKADVCAVLG